MLRVEAFIIGTIGRASENSARLGNAAKGQGFRSMGRAGRKIPRVSTARDARKTRTGIVRADQ